MNSQPQHSKAADPAAVLCDHCGGGNRRRPDGVLRCECGSLLARYMAGRIELKCRRCKRTVAIPLDRSCEERSE